MAASRPAPPQAAVLRRVAQRYRTVGRIADYVALLMMADEIERGADPDASPACVDTMRNLRVIVTPVTERNDASA